MANPIQDKKIPKLIIISGPSGCGKTTMYKKILEKYKDDFIVSVSATTRKPRIGEQDKVDYFFLTKEEFNEKILNKEFLEHAEVHGNQYGTPKEFVSEKLNQGKNVLFDIDWQGAKQITCNHENIDCQEFEIISIFLLPPSLEILKERLKARGTDQNETICQRIDAATEEIKHYSKYDYVLFNYNIDETFENIDNIINGNVLKGDLEKHKPSNQELKEKIQSIFFCQEIIDKPPRTNNNILSTLYYGPKYCFEK